MEQTSFLSKTDIQTLRHKVHDIKIGTVPPQLSIDEAQSLSLLGLLHFHPLKENDGFYTIGGGRLKKPVSIT